MYCRLFFPRTLTNSGELILAFHDLAIVVVLGILGLVVPLYPRALTSPLTYQVLEHENLETIWTLAPILVLVLLAVPSLQLLYRVDNVGGACTGLVAEGRQWYWNYKSVWTGIFDSYLVSDQPRLLTTSAAPTYPDVEILVLVTSSDVLHSFALPAAGVKTDAVPGRLNSLSLEPLLPGLYLGQCRELCGANHRFIPTRFEVR